MNQVGSHTFKGDAPVKRLEIHQGDITAVDPHDPVDVLVVSAFPGDYTASSGSVVGALARKGIRLDELAQSPLYDFRTNWSAWLSKEIPGNKDLGFRHILVFEPEQLPEENIDSLFRALLPILGDGSMSTVATPLVGCGDQGGSVESLLPKLLKNAMHWLNVSPLACLRIIERNEQKAETMQRVFDELQPEFRGYPPKPSTERDHDVFVSYSWDNDKFADDLVGALRSEKPDIRIFRDREKLKTGDDLYLSLDSAVRGSVKFVPLYSPSYIKSNACMREFHTAVGLQQLEQRRSFLHPLYIEKVDSLPSRMKEIMYEDYVGREYKFQEAARAIITSM
jgi:hypothetical protein